LLSRLQDWAVVERELVPFRYRSKRYDTDG
jgi:hypothetical protein